MAAKTRKVVKHYEDKTFGFPIVVLNAQMIRTVGGWVLDIDPIWFEQELLRALVMKPVPLSGNEIRFVRTYFELTLQQFGKRFDVSHAAVIGWEKAENKPTKMNWATEKDIRLFILSQFSELKAEFASAYEKLQEKPAAPSKYIPVEVPYHRP